MDEQHEVGRTFEVSLGSMDECFLGVVIREIDWLDTTCHDGEGDPLEFDEGAIESGWYTDINGNQRELRKDELCVRLEGDDTLAPEVYAEWEAFEAKQKAGE
jgi:hypothetical protein|tara:strand:- start:101 stop:406 length:306 start_codon:yes stop_codon:yes gene_type:complete